MATCDYCDKDVSDHAEACPNCGHPGPFGRLKPHSNYNIKGDVAEVVCCVNCFKAGTLDEMQDKDSLMCVHCGRSIFMTYETPWWHGCIYGLVGIVAFFILLETCN